MTPIPSDDNESPTGPHPQQAQNDTPTTQLAAAAESSATEPTPSESGEPSEASSTASPEPEPEPGYPRHWQADVVLRTGRTARIRPISPADADRLREFYDQVSPESRYLRFFAPMPRLSDRDVKRFTNVDHDRRVALVVTQAEKILAVGRYDTIGPGEAEVAFLVQDAHQGKGIGQLLLEHLAQAGRERGIERFVAEVLPENQLMVQVFHDQGYHMQSGWEDGVIRLELNIDPTKTAFEVMEAREHRAEAASIAALLGARSVAIIGASRRSDSVGGTMVRNLVLGGYTGKVFVVNPAAEAVAGMPAYASIADIEDDVEMAIVVVPADKVQDVVLDCAAKGVHGMIVVSAGFAETGREGRILQRKLVGLARSYGLRLIGPNALGIINTADELRLNGSISPIMPARGRAGFFCQSGALGSTILSKVSGRGLGLSTFVSAGNRADVSGNDLLQYWEEDPSTEVILLYLESIGNPRKFSRIARRISRKKPIIAVRSGRATQGVPMGHAVRSIQAPQPVVDAMFTQAGVIQVDSLDELFDVAQLVAHQPLPHGNRVAIVGNSDAIGLLAIDAAVSNQLEVVRTVRLGAQAGSEEFEDALDEMIDAPDVDGIVAIYLPPLDSEGVEVAHVLAAVAEQADKPIVSTFLGREGVPDLLRVPDLTGTTVGRGSVPSYPAVEKAVGALARAVEYVSWLDRQQDDTVVIEGLNTDAAMRMVLEIMREAPEGRELTFAETRRLLAYYGIEVIERITVNDVEAAVAAGEQFGWGVVLKVYTDAFRQRPDMAHVRRNIKDAAEMRAAFASLSSLPGLPEGAALIVQPTAAPGVPIRVEGFEDPLFGPAVAFSLSGAVSELVGDKAYRIPPLEAGDAAEMVREIKAAPLLFGHRGSRAVNTEAVEDIIRRIGQLTIDLQHISQVILSSAHATEAGVEVMDAMIALQPVVDPRSDWFVRRLNTPLTDTSMGELS